MKDFDFDKMVQLYIDDREAFETETKTFIEQEIKDFCHGDEQCTQRGLTILNGINMKLSRIKNSTVRLIKMQEMMRENIAEMSNKWNDVLEVSTRNPDNTYNLTKSEQEILDKSTQPPVEVIDFEQKAQQIKKKRIEDQQIKEKNND